LLVLDNFEQLVDAQTSGGMAAGPDLVQTLVARVPTLWCLVTSRQKLLIEAEHEYPLLPLPTPSHPGTPERLLEFASVQLFVSRARAARGDFQLSDRNAPAVAELCARLEGIPLAIELAAAWAQTLTPAQMLDRLERRFDLLVSRRRGAPGRHATLRAAVEWSWDLLPEELRRFFARLSVFAGGWTLAAAEQVCDEPNALACLAELRDRSLVLAEEEAAVAGSSPTMRYRLLETLREFAGERLDADERARFRARHAAYFVQQAEQAAPHLHGSREQQHRLDDLQTEHANLRAALEWTRAAAAEEGNMAPDALATHLRLCGALWDFWFLRGHLADAEHWLLRDELVGQAGGDLPGVPPIVLARFLHARAEIARMLDEPDAFSAAMEQALGLYRQAGDKSGEGRVLARLARRRHGLPYAERRRMARRGRRLCRDAGDSWAEAEVLTDLAWLVRCQIENYPRAHRMMARAADLYRAVGDEEHLVGALRERGTWYAWFRETERAAELLGEALALARRRNNRREVAYLLWSLGYQAANDDDLHRAEELLREGVQVARTIGDAFCYVLNFAQLALVLLGRGEDAAAEAMFRECVPRCRRICECNRDTLAELFVCYEGLAILAAQSGDVRRAARLLGLAWAMDRPGPDEMTPPPYPPFMQERYARMRATLQNAPTDLRPDWEWGRALGPTQADRFALGEATFRVAPDVGP
jgi:predicted ATPase